MSNPLRKAGLFSTEVDGQTLIYDATGNQTHCLNPQALKVWELCDGRHSRDAMVQVLRAAADHGAGMQPGDTEELVDAALDRFIELDMLENSALLTRRTIGKAALKALAAGLVLSILMPKRAMAGSVSCDGLDEDQCYESPECLWIGICIPND